MINRSRLWQMLIAGLLFSMTIYWMGPLSQQIVGHLWLKQGVTQAIGGSQTPVTFQERLLAFPGAFDEEPTLHELLKSDVDKGRTPNFKSVSLEVKGRIAFGVERMG